MTQASVRSNVESALRRGIKIKAIGFADPEKYPSVVLELKAKKLEIRRFQRKLPIFMITDSSEVVIAVSRPSVDLIPDYIGVWIRDKLWAGFLEECFSSYWERSSEL